jgi:hypothetical protein
LSLTSSYARGCQRRGGLHLESLALEQRLGRFVERFVERFAERFVERFVERFLKRFLDGGKWVHGSTGGSTLNLGRGVVIVTLNCAVGMFAANGDTGLRFPPSHDMGRWFYEERNGELPVLGRLGDLVDFTDLPSSVQSPTLAALFGAATAADEPESGALTEACGSPGEVANDPSYGHRYMYGLDEQDYGGWSILPNRLMSLYAQVTMVHTMNALYVSDTLT